MNLYVNKNKKAKIKVKQLDSSLFQIFLLMSKQKKRKRALFYDSLLEDDYADYEENEQEQDMWSNIAAEFVDKMRISRTTFNTIGT